MYHNQFELFILVNGKKVREYYHDGKIFIEGKKGSEFTLKFKNNSYQRVLFVPSIDGLSVIDGKEASKNSGGYIVDALRSIEIKGWRTSLDDVASFIFDEKTNSYVNGLRRQTQDFGGMRKNLRSATCFLNNFPNLRKRKGTTHTGIVPFRIVSNF